VPKFYRVSKSSNRLKNNSRGPTFYLSQERGRVMKNEFSAFSLGCLLHSVSSFGIPSLESRRKCYIVQTTKKNSSSAPGDSDKDEIKALKEQLENLTNEFRFLNGEIEQMGLKNIGNDENSLQDYGAETMGENSGMMGEESLLSGSRMAALPVSLVPDKVTPEKFDAARRNLEDTWRIFRQIEMDEENGCDISNVEDLSEAAGCSNVKCETCGGEGKCACRFCHGTGFFTVGDNVFITRR